MWENAEFRAGVLLILGAFGTLFSAWSGLQVAKMRAEKEALEKCLSEKRAEDEARAEAARRGNRRATDTHIDAEEEEVSGSDGRPGC